ncbi:MAG: glycoside hydrolase family 13 [Bacteroidota bacterium]
MSIKKTAKKANATYRVTFHVSPEQTQGASGVYLLGDFNDWQTDGAEMKADKKGGFSQTLELTPGQKYEFRYQTLEGRWFNDEAADDYVPSSAFPHFHNCLVDLPALAKPKAKPKAKGGTKKKGDDLRKIEGIGPKIAGLLQDRGIDSFEALGKAKVSLLKEVLTDAGPRFRMHKPNSWPKQAKLAAKGKWDELKALQDELDGGK